MGQELAANHLNVGPEAVERVARAVHPDEAMPGLHPVDEALRVRQRQVASGVREDDGVVALEVFRAELAQHLLERRVPFRPSPLGLRLLGLELLHCLLVLRLCGVIRIGLEVGRLLR